MSLKTVFVIVLILLSNQVIKPFEQDVKVWIERDKDLYIGTPFSMEVTFPGSDYIDVTYNGSDTLNVFQIIHKERGKRKIGENEELNFRFVLAGFDTGEHDLPPLDFTIYDTSGSTETKKNFSTPSYLFTINTTISDTSFAIKDISPPVRLAYGFYHYAIPIFTVFIIALLFFLLLKRLKKRNIQKIEPEIMDDRPSYVKALEMLESLKAKKLLINRSFLLFYFELSYILRFFIEDYYKIRAVEMTTFEIYSALEIQQISSYKEIVKFLRDCDMVKFAKHEPKYEKADSDMKWLEDYLSQFKKTEPDKEG